MKTILLVDDEYALVETLTELLQDEGYRVTSAANGKDALARLQKEKPDLVVTDFMMPIADGREVLRGMRLLEDFQATPVVMLSATLASVALANPSDAAIVSQFIPKPVSWEKLLAVIVRLIGKGER